MVMENRWLCEGATAEKTRSDRHNTVPLFLRDCIVDALAPPNAGRECLEMRTRKRSGSLLFFRAGRRYADEWTAEWRKEAFSADDRLEQPNGTKRTTRERPLFCQCFFRMQNFLRG
jgi:hypothetical protein